MSKLLLSSILTLGLMGLFTLSSPSASAKEIKDGISYWSVTEMADFKTALDAEAQVICEDDYECRENLHYKRLDLGGQYMALEVFEMERFIVSSINPDAEIIKLYYQDEDKMLSRIYGYPVQIGVKDFYLLWVEESIGNPIEQGGWLMYGQRYPYFLGEKSAVEAATHILVDENQTTSGYGWFTPNEEREYSVAGSQLINDTAHMLYFSLLGTDNGRMDGLRDYSSCFEPSLGYQIGMECKAMFGEDGMIAYFPTGTPRETVVQDDNNQTPDDTNIATTSDDSSNSSSNDDSNNVATVNDIETSATTPVETSSSPIPESIKATPPSTAITTPDTGENGHEFTETDQGSKPEFPWWLGIIFASGLAVLIWLFWPSKQKKA